MQDSRGYSSKDVSVLGGYSEWNRSRDFWKWADLPLETWTSNILSNLHENIVGNTENTYIPSKLLQVHGQHYASFTAKETHYVKIKQFSPSGSLEDALVPILDPGEILAYLVDEVGLSCPSDINRKFWQFSRGKNDHPATDDHVPVSLYGDEVQVNRQGDSITAMYLSLTLFKPKRVRCTHYCIWAMRTHLVAGCHTLWPVLAFVVESLNRAFEGIGKGKTKFALAEIKGDWPWLRKILRFQPSFTGNRVCFLCHSTVFADRIPFYDVETDLDEISTIGFINTMLDTTCSPSPLLLVIGFSPWMVRICTMHTVNLGLCFTVNGACLATLIRCGYFGNPAGGTFEDRLLEAHRDFVAWRREAGVSSSQRRFKRSSALCLKNATEIFNISHVVFVAKFSTYILGTVFAPRDHDFKNLVATLENRPKDCGPSEVDQFAHGSYLSAKAWNSRVLLEWLNDCSRKAALNELPGVGESCLLML